MLMNFRKSFKKLGFRTPSAFRAKISLAIDKNLSNLPRGKKK